MAEEAQKQFEAALAHEQQPLPNLDQLLDWYRQWTTTLQTDTEARTILDAQYRFLQQHRHRDTDQALHQLEQELKWMTSEAKRALVKTDQQSPPQSTGPLPDERYGISNAGLVLLWPFITHFFDHIGLLENEAFKSEFVRERAIMLLQALATGQTKAIESELLLNKLLVGWPLDQPCNVTIDLTPEEEHHITDLLETVIQSNAQLGAAEPKSLQGNFLLREGILTSEHNQWQLHVERKPYDLLLTGFSWSVAITKTPWVDQPLAVEWNTST